MGRQRVLIVEDDPDVRRTLERFLTREGCDVQQAEDGQQAINKLEGGLEVDLVISDLEMPHASGREVLIAGQKRGVPVVILTGQAAVEIAVELMKRGAANFLTKPFTPATLRAVLDDTFGDRDGAVPHKMIGASDALREVVGVIESVAETDATVLIRGESGTGKEVVARALHAASKRAGNPFVAVNCGAIPEALLESELFGHARGAFTGATHARAGRFALAEGGTLFLDEIGDMPLPFQVKLLRVLQERQYTPLGDSEVRSTDVRLIAATHRDLPRMVAEGGFREDLYYRINIIDVELPALRQRRQDVPSLVEHFLQAANLRHGRRVSGISADAMALLAAYDWPGNVRQLANTVERLVVLKKSGEIVPADLPPELRTATAVERQSGATTLPPQGLDLRRAVSDLEESLIDQALQRTGGNKNAAAQLLGLNRTTLVEKLKRKR
jgi:DNA-binding NtrC family response regulator